MEEKIEVINEQLGIYQLIIRASMKGGELLFKDIAGSTWRLSKVKKGENKRWVKLYCKIADNDLIKDEKALQIAIFLLVKNINGSYRVSRYATAEQLGQKPEAFRSALKRLETKYHFIKRNSTNKYTDVSIVNWAKYQAFNTITTPSEHHQNTTNIRYKSKDKELPLTDDERKILNFLKTQDKIKNPTAYLGWLKKILSPSQLKQLLKIEFPLWSKYFEEWGIDVNKK